MEIVKHVIHAVQGKHPITARRSSHWASVRAQHLKNNPCCAVCGGTEKLEVHHIKPFHLHPDLELLPANLITLCEANHGGMNCHLAVGHLGNYRSFNVDVQTDAKTWAQKITNRPLSDNQS